MLRTAFSSGWPPNWENYRGGRRERPALAEYEARFPADADLIRDAFEAGLGGGVLSGEVLGELPLGGCAWRC